MMLAGRSLLRPALLEATLAITAGVAAVPMVEAGLHKACTSLTEFGMLGVITAISSAIVAAGYADSEALSGARGLSLLRWSIRCRAAGYGALIAFAALNAVLDLAVPRRDPDVISFPGLAAVVAAVLVFAVVWETKCRALDELQEPALLLTLTDDAFFIVVGLMTAIALAVHIAAPVWWIDTTVSAATVLLAVLRLTRIIAMRRVLVER